MRATPRSDWATYNDLKESIAMVFDVATLIAAPTLFVRWRVRYVAFERESHPFTAPRPLGNLLSPSSRSFFLCLCVSLTPDHYVDFSLSYTLAHARRKSANAPDADVGPPLIHPPRRPRSFSVLNPLLRDMSSNEADMSLFPIVFILSLKMSAIFAKQIQPNRSRKPASWIWKNFLLLLICGI